MGRHKERLLLALILLVALGLRLWDPGGVEFKYDEADILLRAQEVLRGRGLPVVGSVGSVGIPNPPLMVYLHALPLVFSSSPLSAVIFIGSLNALAVWAMYILARRFLNGGLALIAALLFAVNPWAVHFGRKIGTHILPLLSLVAVYALVSAIVERRRSYLILFFMLVALLTQSYLLAFLYLPGVAILLFLFRSRFRPRVMLEGLGLFVLLSAPFAAYLVSNWEEAVSALRGAVLSRPAQLDVQALRFSFWLASGFNLEALLGRAAPRLAAYPHLLLYIHWATIILVGIGIISALGAIAARRQGWEGCVVLFIWWLVPVALLSYHSHPMHIHYLNLVQGLPTLLMAIGLAQIISPRSRYLRGLGLVLLVVMSGIQAAGYLAVSRQVQAYDTQGGFGVPLKYWQGLADLAKQEARARSTRKVYSFVEGADFRYAEMPAILRAVLEPDFSPHLIGLEEGHRLLVLGPERGAVYMVPPGQSRIYEELERFGLEAGRVVLPGGEREGRVYVLWAITSREVEFLTERQVSAEFENGARLLGYDLAREARSGEEVWLTLYWSFQSLRPELAGREYVVFNHLVDEEGRKWAQKDGFGWPTYEWQEGEVVAWYRFQLPKDMPSGKYMVLVGMYDWRDGMRSPLVGESGQRAGDAVELGPIVVGSR